MADKVIVDPKEKAAHNATEIQKQANQDISGKPVGGELDMSHTISALDALRDTIVEEKKKAANVDELGAPVVEKTDEAKAAEKKAADDKETADKAAEAAKGITPVTPAADDPAAVEAARVLEEAKAAEKKAADNKAADDYFKDAPKLPPNASPKSSEAFLAIKIRATQEISRLQTELEKATKTAKDLEDRAKEALTPEVRQELESLREFKLRLDIETDPKFKEFDKGISAAHEFIYAQLKKSPAVTDDVIAKIKELGGPENVKLEQIFSAINDPMIQRLVEAKLADVELAKYNKDQAIASTKSDIKKYLADRQKQWEASASSHNTQTEAELNGLIARVGWLNPITVDSKADEAARKAAEAHNEYAKNIRKEIDMAKTDDSPAMRATLLIGMAQLFRLQSAHELTVKERDALKKELGEVKGTVARLTASSTSKLRESAAPASGLAAPVAKPSDQFTVRAGDALDQIRAAKMQAQQQAA